MTVQKEAKIVKLGLIDTAGQISYEKLRLHLYKDVDVFLICYSVVNPISYCNVIDKVSVYNILGCVLWLLCIQKQINSTNLTCEQTATE